MKKTISVVIVSLLILAMTVFAAKPVKGPDAIEYFDIDGDGELEEVWIESSHKVTKKSDVMNSVFFTENYREYLGQELIVNGEVVVDTFVAND
jgi:hypothetical protein